MIRINTRVVHLVRASPFGIDFTGPHSGILSVPMSEMMRWRLWPVTFCIQDLAQPNWESATASLPSPPRDISGHLSYLCQYSSSKTFCSWDQDLPTPSQENHTRSWVPPDTCIIALGAFAPYRPIALKAASLHDTDKALMTNGNGDQEESRGGVGVDTHHGLPSQAWQRSWIFPEDCLTTRRAIATPGTSLSLPQLPPPIWIPP